MTQYDNSDYVTVSWRVFGRTTEDGRTERHVWSFDTEEEALEWLSSARVLQPNTTFSEPLETRTIS